MEINNKNKTPNTEEIPKVLLIVGTELLAAVIVGVAIGVFLDKILKTKPIMIIVFFFFGCMAGFYNIFKILKDVKK